MGKFVDGLWVNSQIKKQTENSLPLVFTRFTD